LMLGHLMEWFYSGIGGIRQEEKSVAFKQVLIHPEIVAGLSHAETTYHSPYGRIATAWKKDRKTLHLEVEIPANTTAMVSVPITDSQQVKESGKVVQPATGQYEKDRVFIKTGSGKYHFIIQ
jgi:alpha-L-rhamnosidase